jgi:hypothetical protein
MKLPITIQYQNGEESTFTAAPPEWMKWEQKTGNTISQAQDKIGVADLLILANQAMNREEAGKPVKQAVAIAYAVKRAAPKGKK